MTSGDIANSWKRLNPAPTAATGYVAAGSYRDADEARRIASRLTSYGKVEIERSTLDGDDWYSVNLYPAGRGNLDEMLKAAWAHGAPDALAVRD
jgi:rare lipoprotein A